MLILSQTADMKGYHGTIGTPTNMYDYRGEPLFVGDIVCLVTYGDNGKKQDDYGIEFVCEENTNIVSWTGTDKQYVMGIARTYNNTNFEILEGIDVSNEEWWEKFETIDDQFRVYKVKDHSLLVEGETIGFLKVVHIDDTREE